MEISAHIRYVLLTLHMYMDKYMEISAHIRYILLHYMYMDKYMEISAHIRYILLTLHMYIRIWTNIWKYQHILDIYYLHYMYMDKYMEISARIRYILLHYMYMDKYMELSALIRYILLTLHMYLDKYMEITAHIRGTNLSISTNRCTFFVNRHKSSRTLQCNRLTAPNSQQRCARLSKCEIHKSQK